MQEKTNSKIVAEITSKDSKITENEVNKIETLEDVSSINRIGRQEVLRFWGKDILKHTDECVQTIEEIINEIKFEILDLDDDGL